MYPSLEQEQQFSETALAKLIEGRPLRGFFGGMVLRGEGHAKGVTGRLSLLRSETPIGSSIGKRKSKGSLLEFGLTTLVLL